MDEDEIRRIPIIVFPGSEDWKRVTEWGLALDAQYPGQDADQFAWACEYNRMGPALALGIAHFHLVKQGQRDGENWIWRIKFEDGTTWTADGWCDYTGWDCRSDLVWEKVLD